MNSAKHHYEASLVIRQARGEALQKQGIVKNPVCGHHK